jgi:hypothetical protein
MLRGKFMSTRSAVIQVEPDLAEAFNAVPKLEQERIKSAMRSLLRLVPPAHKKARRLSKRETELFLKINLEIEPPACGKEETNHGGHGDHGGNRKGK